MFFIVSNPQSWWREASVACPCMHNSLFKVCMTLNSCRSGCHFPFLLNQMTTETIFLPNMCMHLRFSLPKTSISLICLWYNHVLTKEQCHDFHVPAGIRQRWPLSAEPWICLFWPRFVTNIVINAVSQHAESRREHTLAVPPFTKSTRHRKVLDTEDD